MNPGKTTDLEQATTITPVMTSECSTTAYGIQAIGNRLLYVVSL